MEPANDNNHEARVSEIMDGMPTCVPGQTRLFSRDSWQDMKKYMLFLTIRTGDA